MNHSQALREPRMGRKILQALYAAKGIVLGPPVDLTTPPPAPAGPPEPCLECGAAVEADAVLCRYCRMKGGRDRRERYGP